MSTLCCVLRALYPYSAGAHICDSRTIENSNCTKTLHNNPKALKLTHTIDPVDTTTVDILLCALFLSCALCRNTADGAPWNYNNARDKCGSISAQTVIITAAHMPRCMANRGWSSPLVAKYECSGRQWFKWCKQHVSSDACPIGCAHFINCTEYYFIFSIFIGLYKIYLLLLRTQSLIQK